VAAPEGERQQGTPWLWRPGCSPWGLVWVCGTWGTPQRAYL